MGETGIKNGTIGGTGGNITISSDWINDTAGNAYLKNTTLLNTSTVTVGRNVNGTVEFTTAAATAVNVTNVTYLANGTFDATINNSNNGRVLVVTCWGAGGGGGGTDAVSSAPSSGGGGGAVVLNALLPRNLVYTVVVGPGGDGGPGGSLSSGKNGTNTSFYNISYNVGIYAGGGGRGRAVMAGVGGSDVNATNHPIITGRPGQANFYTNLSTSPNAPWVNYLSVVGAPGGYGGFGGGNFTRWYGGSSPTTTNGGGGGAGFMGNGADGGAGAGQSAAAGTGAGGSGAGQDSNAAGGAGGSGGCIVEY